MKARGVQVRLKKSGRVVMMTWMKAAHAVASGKAEYLAPEITTAIPGECAVIKTATPGGCRGGW